MVSLDGIFDSGHLNLEYILLLNSREEIGRLGLESTFIEIGLVFIHDRVGG